MVDHPSHETGGKAEERENDSVGNQFSSLKQALQQRLGPSSWRSLLFALVPANL